MNPVLRRSLFSAVSNCSGMDEKQNAKMGGGKSEVRSLDCGWLNGTCFTSSFYGAWNGLTVSLD